MDLVLLFVIALVVLGIVVDRLIRRAGAATDDAARTAALGRAELAAEATTGLGAVIVLLTAAAQLSVPAAIQFRTGCSGDRGNRRAGTGPRGGPNQDEIDFRTLDRPIPE